METDSNIALERLESYIDGFWWILPNLVIGLIILLIFIGAAWLTRRLVVRFFRRRKRPDLGRLLGGFAQWFVIGLGLLVVTAVIFPSVRPADILATLGVGSIAVGFAFKDILQNWLAGLLILLRQPFRQRDQIIVGKNEGTVERIEARATVIRTYDNRRVIIPNNDVYTEAVVVNTAYDLRRSEMDIGIGYGDDVEMACRTIAEALVKLPGVSSDPMPVVIPWEFAGSSVNLKVIWWTAPYQAEVLAVRGAIVTSLRRSMRDTGIDLPFPTRVVLFHDQTEEADGDRSRQREGWPPGIATPARRSEQVDDTIRAGNKGRR